MYLKRIEISGFKSFADRTVIDFETGMTAIVGPNGCGKSNVSDAIRWVLGEQNPRLLRGNDMQDIIFNGTDDRRAIGRAEVSITIINDDQVLPVEFHEVLVTRRLYRSGESQYLLNGTVCRLMDIRQLFLGTGIGTSGYYMMEQGRIDKILSAKPEDRRAIFEEAAGILKFKLQKKTALNRLQATEDNLVRLNDILREVKRQIISLERQAGKARRYKTAKDELKDLELKFAKNEDFQYMKLYEEMHIKLGKLKEEKNNINETKEQLRTQFNLAEKEYDHNLESSSQVEQKILRVSSEIEKNQQEIQHIQENLSESQGRLKVDEVEFGTAKERLYRLKAQLETEKQRVESFESDFGVEKEKLILREEKASEQLREIELKEKTLEEVKVRIVDLASQETHGRNQKTALSEKIRMQTLRIEKLNAECEKIQQISESKHKQNNEVGAILSHLDEEVRDLKAGLEESSRNGEMYKGDFDQAQSEYEQLKVKVEQERFRYELLSKPRQVKTIGFIRQLLEKLGLAEGRQYRILADALQIPREYQKSIYAVLGDKKTAVLINNKTILQGVMSYAHRDDFGGMHFLALDAKSENITDVPWAGQEGVLGLLKGFIQYPAELNSVIDLLLQKVVLVRDLTVLQRLADEVENSWRIVTLNGDLLDWDGTLRCAYKDEFSIEMNSQEFENKLENMHLEVKQLENKRDQCEEGLKKSRDEEERLRSRIHETELLQAKQSGEIEHIQHKVHELSDALVEMRDETEALEEEKGGWEKDLSDRTPLLEQLQILISKENEQLHSIEQFLKGEGLDKSKVLMELAEVRVLSREIQENNERVMVHQNELIELIEETQGNIGRREKEMSDIHVKIHQLEERQKTLSHADGPLHQEREAIQFEKKGFAQVLLESKAKIEELRISADACRESLDEIAGRIQDDEINLREISLKRDSLRQRYHEKYEVDLKSQPIPSEEQNWEQVREKINELDQKIKTMGEVNVLAIGEYDSLKERFKFLDSQQEDLINAKENIVKAIQKINKTTKEMFAETFVQIRESFRDCYRLLFGGGRADISLVDEGDVLESGIEIVAQPPGKKLQSISLLSGGEKSLTALALLLSIFKVKPSPFCFMDEMDAALDEANIGRFLKILNEFKMNTQFVVITHSKKTITLADAIYGVTMEESGVSKIYSIKIPKSSQKEAISA